MSARDFTGATLSGADLTPLESPPPAPTLEYNHLLWGELVYGTKAEIQSFGIAVGRAFPGEPGGPKRKLNVLDPRGFHVNIDVAYDGSRYCASISFPGRKEPKLPASEFARGVMKRTDMSWGDEYIGTGEALAAAGLVRMDQLPGQPGMRKTRVVIFADGSIPSGAPTVRHACSEEPGAKAIERVSKTTYSVRVHLSEGEQKVRVEAHKRARAEYEGRMRAMSRPVPLDAPAHMLPGRAKENLRSVWSAHGSAPGFSVISRAAPPDLTALQPLLEPAEICLLQAYRAADDRARDNIFRIAQRFSEEWPRHTRPALQVIIGGAHE